MEATRRASPDYGLAPHQHHDDHHHRGRRRTRSLSRSRSRSPAQGGRTQQHRAAPLSRRRRRRASPPPPSAARRQDELERAARTVLAHSLPVRAGERELFEFFRAAGRVTDVRVIYDRARRSRGIAYVEFASADEAAAALALAGAPLMGVPVQVRPPEAEKNAAWEAARAARRAAGGQPMSAAEVAAVLGAAGMTRPPRPALAEVQAAGGGAAAAEAAAAAGEATTAGPCITLRVSGLPAALRGSEVREMFGVFGALQSVLVEAAAGATTTPTDDDGGVVATLTFAVRQEGLQALEHWNGQELLGRALEVVEVADAAAGDGVVAGATSVPAAAGALDAEAAAAMVRAMAAPKAAAVAGVADVAAHFPSATDAAALATALPPPPPAPAAAAPLSDPVAAAEAAAAAAASVAAAAAAAAAQPKARELDEESAGFRLTGQARVDLMRRLGGGAAADLAPPPPPASAAPQPAVAVVPVVASAAPPSPSRAAAGSLVGPAVIPGPTRCLLLRNMFGSPEEAEQADGPDWPSLLEQDARDACEQAFPSAPPDHVFVDARGESGGAADSGGCVYARLPTAEAALAAQRMLHGRFYAGRVVAAAFQDEAAYARRFGLQP